MDLDAAALLARLRALDVRLWVKAGALRYSAPAGVLTAELLGEVRRRKAGLLAILDGTAAPVGSGEPDRAERIVPVTDGDRVASFAQERLWFLEAMGAAGPAFHLPLHQRWRGPVDRAALRRALSALVDRHEALRTGFRAAGGRALPVVRPEAGDFPLPLVDVRALDPAAREAEGRRLAGAETRRPFDLARPPLFRATLVALADEEHALLQTVHHIAADGWSLGILVRELAALYDAFAAERPDPLSPLPIQHGDFAAWQRRRLAGAALDGPLAYWTRHLAGLPPLDLPADRRPTGRPGATASGGGVALRVPESVAGPLRRLASAHGVTLYMTLLAAFQALLHRYTGRVRIAVAGPVAHRDRPETAGVVGPFANLLVFATDLSGDPDFLTLLSRVRDVTLAAQAHGEMPFERLVEALQPDRDLDRHPLVQVSFTLQPLSGIVPRPRTPGLEVTLLPGGAPEVRLDLELHAWAEGDTLGGVLLYRADRFAPARMERMARHLEALLAAVALDPRRPVGALALLDPEERAALVARGRATAAHPVTGGLHDLVATQAAARPDAVAVTGPAEGQGDDAPAVALTYAALNARANRLAHRLRRLGVGPERRVALGLGRSVELAVGMLAILKAGGAYVPLDPDYPAERLAYLLADARPVALVTSQARAARLAGPTGFTGPVVHVDDPSLAAEPSSSPAGAVDPASLAYVIYTSGSTGQPKGVAMPHAPVVRLFAATRGWFGFDAATTWSLFHSPAFDFSVWELWGALTTGGRVAVAPYWVTRSPRDFHAWLCREGVTLLSQTPSAFRQLLAVEAAGGPQARDETPPLDHVVFGGEALPFASLRPWVARHGDRAPRLVNMYGITETTVHVSYRPVTRDDAARGGSFIGGPIPDLDLHLLDGRGEPVPDGVTGELYVGGAGLARGYLGRPGLTAERFVPHPFRAGARLYRSGDLARSRTGDGGAPGAPADLEYLGRRDAQVKLRGFRIEPAEVEAALRAHPGVADAVVTYRDDGPRGPRLAAYVVPAGGGALAGEALRRDLLGRLPEHLVPGRIVTLAGLPLTPHGKLDRAALPSDDEAAGVPEGASSEAPGSPEGPDEEILTGLVGRLLGLDRVSRHAGFFELGGHSLLAMQLVADVREAFGVELPVRRVFEAPTLAGLAAAITALRRAPEASPPPLVARPGGSDRAVLSFAQTRLWLLHQLEPDSAAYHVPAAYRLRGPLDPPALIAALRVVAGRHAVLRTVIDTVDGAPVARAGDPSAFRGPVVDLAALPAASRWAAVERLAARESERPFRLDREWPLRARLLVLGSAEHVLLLTLHHIAADGWSLGLLLGELGVAYGALARGAAPEPAPLPVSHAEYAAWQRRWLDGEGAAGPLRYWREALRDLPPLALPLDRPRSAEPAGRTSDAGGAHGFQLSAELTARLRTLAQGHHATLFMTLLAGFAALLSRHGGGADVAVGAPVTSRSRAELSGVIGPFVNMLVFRVDLRDDPTFGDLLARVRRTVLDGVAHQDVPFERVVEALQPERDLHRHPLFQVSLTLQPPGAVTTRLRLGDVEAEALDPGFRRVRFDLELHAWEAGDGVAGTLLYRRALFRPATVAALVRRLERLLAGAAASPEARVSGLPLVDPHERRALVARGARRRSTPGPREAVTLHERLAAVAARRPTALAVGGAAEPDQAPGPAPLTYGELDRRANRLAHRLRALGAGPETRIALLVERSPALVVGLLGILKAGAAYVPLDPTHPAPRLAYLLGDARPVAVVTSGALRGRLPACPGPVVDLDGDAAALAAGPVHAPESGATPDSLAYVIYTSGSTGQPKGVEVTHRNVTRLFDATDATFGFHEGMVWSLFHSVAFDFSVWELWGALLHGGRVVVVPYWVSRSPRDFHALLRREGVTVLSQTPSAFRALAAADAEVGPGDPGGPLRLSHVVFGGEALDFRTLRGWCDRHGDEAPRLVNMYGITETTVHVTSRRVRREDLADPRSLIGAPLPDLDLHVLDERGEPVPDGVPGELYVGGAGLARGYLGREALTRERFVPHPFRPGERIYRTGDRGRPLPGGDVEYLGRLDAQVQLRGFRVEPGEVEAALRAHPAVRDAVVLARDGGPRGPRLAAYAVCGGPAGGALPATLRSHLAAMLPEHMVPAAVTVLDALPLTANGKLDRAALLALEAGAPGEAPAAEPGELPAAPDAALLAALWRGLLGAAVAGPEASFFEAGGHSLLAAQLVARLRDAFGVEIPLRQVFERPTFAALLGSIRAARVAATPGSDPLPPITPTGGDAGVLSFSQERLWFLDQLEAGAPTFNVPLALRLRGPLRPAAVRASLTALQDRHQVLRTRIGRDGDLPRPMVDGPSVALPLLDLGGLAGPAAARAERACLRAEAARPFDLGRERPLRALLLRHDDGHHVLALTLHHVACDAWSLPILWREWAALHAALAAGLPAEAAGLAPLPVQYADVAAWQRRHLTDEVLGPDLAYWRRELAGAPERLALPPDRPRPAVAGAGGRLAPFRVDPQVARDLRALGADTGATPFMVLCAAYAAFLFRQTGQVDLVVGTPVAGRERTETEPLVGCFVNTLCLRLDLGGRPSFRELVRRVRRVALGAYDHQRLPFARLVAALQPERRLGHAPLVQTMFDLVPPGAIAPPALAAGTGQAGSPAAAGLAVEPVACPVETAKFDLGLSMGEAAGTFVGCWEYRTDLFTAETAERWTAQLLALLRAAAARPDDPVDALALEGAREREVRLAASTGEPLDPAGSVGLAAIVAAGAVTAPDAVAVVAPGPEGGDTAHVTHGALVARAASLARRLRREHRIGPEAVVAVLLPRSPELVTALLAILAAGGAYLPLDPDHPDERLRVMRRGAGARVLVTLDGLAARVAEPGVSVVSLDPRAGGPDGLPVALGPVPVPAGALAAVLFTSGSTGTPKGVLITQGAQASFTRAAIRRYAVTGADRVLQFASPGFDTAGEEIYPALVAGGTVVLRTDAAATSTAALLDESRRHAVTVLDLPTAYWHQLVADLGPGGSPLPPSVRLTIIGGERARPEAVAAWLRAVGPAPRLLNTYGPTEATVVATAADLSRPGRPALAEVSIGRPLPGATALVLDARDALAAVGVPGELRLGGAGVARGYAGRPGETAARFVPHPFGRGERLYRTGDRARVLPDGELQYLGRLDAQVKVRGHRVEPGEIEVVLLRQAGVREAAVVWREDGTGDGRLVAYVVAKADAGADPPAVRLREALRRALPEALIPAAIVALPVLPRTPGGKVDRRALPAPDRAASTGAVAYVAPGSADEAALAILWAEVLGLDRVGVDDSFFDLGGHSLGLLALQRRLRERFGRELPLVDLFRFPTVRTLAAHLREGPDARDPAIPRAQAAAERQRAALARFPRPSRGVG